MNVLIIDNYDSFTFNLYQYVGEILQTLSDDKETSVTVKRNNEITLAEVEAMNLDRIIISPGPGSPDDPAYFGICSEVIEKLGKTVPILGVCLGMQGIAHVFGGDVIRASVPMHGKVSSIRHDGKGIYQDLPQALEIMRYHSLVVKADTIPSCLTITSVVANENRADLSFDESALTGDEIMGLKHKEYPIQGVQFHPESFATEGAKRLLSNFLLQV
ncbi:MULTISPECIES: anthranilate synthase component II [Psychrobacter]|jgi:anthranilate synthase component 2|uniref:anthranilate synthase component II n=1 Tax=Psychrobacter TaxID=497 RepID=UPI0016466A9F|nr:MULTISPECIES: aminodeoxychorismate/anthranilate synthase component II [unclassified Psychrobacter]MEC9444189.1 aminodeoxychorismate/anthranilate synthase component II [Pseudomonadota bacterium]MED6315936.1 aminodeoxychorismate/anthranilate synthase component II [Pseudomonadota bacterium]|tara:strand:- start:2772 stop:3419 length:648 start_codon:yes stop_codon:yes gene_type:complete